MSTVDVVSSPEHEPAMPGHLQRSWPVALVLAAALLTTARVIGPKLSLDWWYDEMWRVDLMRRDEWRSGFISEATPLPPIWFFFLRAALRPVYLGAPAARAVAGVLVATAPLAVAWLAAVALRRDRTEGSAAVAGAAVAVAVMSGPFSAAIFSYLNNYAFEAGIAIAAVAAVAAAPRDRPITLPVMISVILLPACTIAGLLLLPGLGLFLVWRVWRQEDQFRRIAARRLAATIGCSGAVACATYLLMYRAALGRETTASFFEQERFDGDLGDVPAGLWRLLEGLLTSNALPFAPSWVSVALVVAGAIVTARRLPFLLPTIGLALLGTLAASRLTGFPAVATRVHAPLVLLASSIAAIGAIALATMAVGQIRRWDASAGAGIALALLALLRWAPQEDEPPWKGLRGITQDIAPIIGTDYSRNVVVSYHWMTRWTVHDRLVNGPTDEGVAYRLLGERRLGVENSPRLDQPVYERLPELVDDAPDAAVWCVLPYDMGPEAFRRACLLDGTGRRRVVARHGPRAEVVLWTPVGS